MSTADLLSDVAVDQLREIRRLRDENRKLRNALADAYAFIERRGYAGSVRKLKEKQA